MWVAGFVLLGYYFGNLPIIRSNFSLVIFLIIGISLLPALIEVWRQRRPGKRANP